MSLQCCIGGPAADEWQTVGDSQSCAASANCPSYKRFPLSNYRVLLEKLTVPQPVKKFLAFYGTQPFIATFTTALPPVPILCHSNPVNAPSNLLKIRFNTILPFNTRSSKWHLSHRFPHLNSLHTSPFPHTCHMPHPSQSSWFYHPNHTSLTVQILQLLTTQFPSVPCSLMSLRPNVFPTTL